MKKILFAIAFVFVMSLGATAQNDGFFRANEYDDYNYRYDSGNGVEFWLPTMHGNNDDAYAPLGSGLFILGVLGAGYATLRRRKK